MRKDKIYCALDLELEQPSTNPQTPDSVLSESKIIQIGYVIYTIEPSFEVLAHNSIYINIGVPLSAFIRKLTGITDNQVAQGTDIQTGYNELAMDHDKYKFNRIIIQWGGGDIETLKEEVDPSTWKFGRTGFNLKHLYRMYAEMTGLNPSGGLAKCMSKCELKWEGRGKHNALTDAYNTARFHSFLYTRIKESLNA